MFIHDNSEDDNGYCIEVKSAYFVMKNPYYYIVLYDIIQVWYGFVRCDRRRKAYTENRQSFIRY